MVLFLVDNASRAENQETSDDSISDTISKPRTSLRKRQQDALEEALKVKAHFTTYKNAVSLFREGLKNPVQRVTLINGCFPQ